VTRSIDAIAGTPNLNGIAWLLIQHYDALGKKTIESVTVWSIEGFTNGEVGDKINILVELVPAP